MGQRNPAPENGGKHPIHRLSTILLVMQDFFHPQYGIHPEVWLDTTPHQDGEVAIVKAWRYD